MSETSRCDQCNWSFHTIHPITGQQMFQEYKGRTLCATCLVDERIEDDYYNDE